MEIGWYLRFAKSDRIELTADPGAVPQIFYVLDIHPEWDVDIENVEDHVVAHYRRKEPVWSRAEAAGQE